MNQATWTYLAQLTRALRVEGVEGRSAGEFVAEVESHLAETGADPIAEFGAPFELAAEVARRPGAHRPGWVPPLWWAWVLGLVATAVLVAAVEAVFLGWDDRGVPVRARGLLWVGGVYGASTVAGYLATRRLDGRSWRALFGLRFFLVVVGIAFATTTLATMARDTVVTRIPVGPFWVGAAIVVPALLAVVAGRNNAARFPSHARHLRRLKWGPLAGAPPR
jgi:hypothetical protein